MNTLTKDQLDSITPDTIKTYRKVKAILANLDIHSDDSQFLPLMREGMAAREFGLTYKRIETLLEEKSQL